MVRVPVPWGIALVWLFVVALADHFEEDYTGGDGNVEGTDWAAGWDRDEKIAALARQLVQAFAFAAQHDTHLA